MTTRSNDTPGRDGARCQPKTHRAPQATHRRRHRRRPVDLRFRAAHLSGRVLDWSRGGLALESEGGLRVGARYALTIHSATRSRRVRGTVRWCALRRTLRTSTGEVHPVYQAGIDFSA